MLPLHYTTDSLWDSGSCSFRSKDTSDHVWRHATSFRLYSRWCDWQLDRSQASLAPSSLSTEDYRSRAARVPLEQEKRKIWLLFLIATNTERNALWYVPNALGLEYKNITTV